MIVDLTWRDLLGAIARDLFGCFAPKRVPSSFVPATRWVLECGCEPGFTRCPDCDERRKVYAAYHAPRCPHCKGAL